MTRFVVACASALIAIPLSGALRADEPAEVASSAARLVEFDDLAKRLGDTHVRVLDARPRADYEKGHIPGAVWVDTKSAAKIAGRPDGLTDKVAWEAWITPLAISPEMEVLIYDGGRQLDAARTWWLLGYLGVTHVGLVNGNFPLWVKQGRPTDTDVPELAPKTVPIRFAAHRHATRDEVLESLDDGGVHIIDARSEDEHTGARKSSKRGGHIPDACHLEWNTLVDANGRFVDQASLRARLTKLGVKQGAPVITHCQGGGRASVDMFALERIGHPARNYYLGWSDWGNVDHTPVETGKTSDKR